MRGPLVGVHGVVEVVGDPLDEVDAVDLLAARPGGDQAGVAEGPPLGAAGGRGRSAHGAAAW